MKNKIKFIKNRFFLVLISCILFISASAHTACCDCYAAAVTDAAVSADTSSVSEAPACETGTVAVKDSVTRYIKFGSGSKIMVILPGLTINFITDNCDVVADAYSQFCDAYTIYLFCIKDDVPEGCTLEELAEDTAAACTALGISDAYVLGISMGGFLGIYLASEYPELVSKLLLASSAARSNSGNDKLLTRWSKLADVCSRYTLAYNMVSYMYSDATISEFGDMLTLGYEFISNKELKRFSHTAAAIIGFDFSDRISLIKCPLYVMGSYGDQVLGPEASLEIAELTGCPIYMYSEEYGHAFFDEAEDFSDRVYEFFKSE